MAPTPPTAKEILPVLQQVLEYLSTDPHPHVPTPEGCRRRASVSIILRVRPAFVPVPAVSSSTIDVNPTSRCAKSLPEFFSQDWVQKGDPEILFIKRPNRSSDRWSSHVALPGGKRDPEDESDAATAVREAREEVGLDLSADNCLYAGNLPERIVATTFGRQALMVLCPYIYVLTSSDVPRVLPQPTEVASAHWVPVRALLSDTLRTREYVDTASRMAKPGGPVAQFLLRTIVGKMVFSAIHLTPSESIYASSIDGFIPAQAESHLRELAMGAISQSLPSRQLTHQQPLILWGLTLGVLADFLDMLPPHNAVRLWRYPTFTTLDLRLFVYLFTYDIRKKQVNVGDLSAGTWPYQTRRPSRGNQTAIDSTTEAVVVTEENPSQNLHGRLHNSEVGIGGLGVHAVGKLLAGYYERVNVAVVCFVIYRTILGSALGYWMFRKWKRRCLPV